MTYCRKHKSKAEVACLACREEKEAQRGSRQAKADRQSPRARKRARKDADYITTDSGLIVAKLTAVQNFKPLFSNSMSVTPAQFGRTYASIIQASALSMLTSKIDATFVPPEPLPVEDGTLIEGWRQYGIMFDNDGFLVLHGVRAQWPAAELEATCAGWATFVGDVLTEQDRAPEHLLAGECSCGIYVARAAPELDYNRPWAVEVIARCSAWGVCVEYERGWRCQHVRVECLYVGGKNPRLWDELAERYGVPVASLETLAITR